VRQWATKETLMTVIRGETTHSQKNQQGKENYD